MKPHCSILQKFMRFETIWILVFGVPNTKNLTFGTPDVDALIMFLTIIIALC